MAFFSSGDHDYICMDDDGRIVCSGDLLEMLLKADRSNYAVAQLTPVRYKLLNRSTVRMLSDEMFDALTNDTKKTNEKLRAKFLGVAAS